MEINDRYLKNDIAEIKAFIAAYGILESDDSAEALSRITEETAEDYLDRRAEYLRKDFDTDKELQEKLSEIAAVCDITKCEECPIRKYCNHYINAARRGIGDDQPQMIDLFCGAGGLSLGFTEEGFVTALANDIQECCIDTYAHNHPETERKNIVLGDVSVLVDNIDSYVGDKRIDIIVGGPPCQGFSFANRQRLIDDPRNQLYRNFVKAVDSVRPPFFVMENVKGMLSVAEQVKEDFRNVGYEVEAHILNAKDYGVPQNRERLIYIGNNQGIDNSGIFNELYNLSKNIPDHKLGDALYGLRPLEASRRMNATEVDTEVSGRKIDTGTGLTNEYINYINQGRQISIVCNHKARYNNDRDIQIFGRLNPGDNSLDPKIADIMPYASRNDIFKDKYFKLQMDEYCKTITAHMKFDCNMYIHPEQARGLTPREAARVQSYPDDYFFRGSYTKTYMQIGNSVPPILGRAIASVIKPYIINSRRG